ncbi:MULTISPECIES: MATE family efflux transporter [unclassified Bradyrhizobium]|uniref:MATE family efflux transporter n=1 Tax=unclassified Bradyrhizobium TaxID=2631580 RepID=UPI001CD5313A|nr:MULTISPECIES: MATE family efflux transporter [unclassified Bradyrhizobium]MCA1373892.1 MATE family efflux transporter [Bradyrhizobium sp. IC4060]MCA1485233.1 MATE family efflux transporter [Bradyrhizobium sp. IC4061]MCA1540251.1 MATE family efflux transporter [Bradyrhizobium sp. NBAIM32]
MKDLTRGSIASHILSMAPPIMAGMISIMICQLVDLYFVSGLGDAAVAGVAAAGNAGFLVNGLIQVLGVGTVALIAHAVGRKDRRDANLIFNQAVALSVLFGLLILVMGAVLSRPYMRSIAADQATIEAGTTYLLWFMPALALEFVMQVIASALSATGIVRPAMLVRVLAVIINIALAPVLISGWGTGYPLGVAGAGLASTIAVGAGVLMLLAYFRKVERYVAFNPVQWRPQPRHFKRILNVGLPAGGEFAMMFIFMAVVYYVLRDFGAAAQAGFGIGQRVLALIQMPALAVALAAGPIAGQNFGAGDAARVRETFVKSVLITSIVAVGFMILAQLKPELLLAGFSNDRETVEIAYLFLRIISLNMVAQGLIFTCSSMFQGLGNTKPVLLSSMTRVLTYSLPVLWLSTRPGFRIEHVWHLSIAATTLQAGLSLWLLRREFGKRFAPRDQAAETVEAKPVAPSAPA